MMDLVFVLMVFIKTNDRFDVVAAETYRTSKSCMIRSVLINDGQVDEYAGQMSSCMPIIRRFRDE